MVLLISCKADQKIIEMDDAIGNLIKSNMETPGTDCMVISLHNPQ